MPSNAYPSLSSVKSKLFVLGILVCTGLVIWWLVRTYAPNGIRSTTTAATSATSASARDTAKVLACTIERQVTELKEPHTVLHRPVKDPPQRKHDPVPYVPCTALNAQLLWGPGNPESAEYVLSSKDPEAPVGDKDLLAPTAEEVELVEKAQPAFIDNGPAIAKRTMDSKGKRYLFYFDREFPEQPVNVEFLKDREAFIKERQFEYPSILASSRLYDLLKPDVASSSLSLTTIPVDDDEE